MQRLWIKKLGFIEAYDLGGGARFARGHPGHCPPVGAAADEEVRHSVLDGLVDISREEEDH